jgi:hypothetical protein
MMEAVCRGTGMTMFRDRPGGTFPTANLLALQQLIYRTKEHEEVCLDDPQPCERTAYESRPAPRSLVLRSSNILEIKFVDHFAADGARLFRMKLPRNRLGRKPQDAKQVRKDFEDP